MDEDGSKSGVAVAPCQPCSLSICLVAGTCPSRRTTDRSLAPLTLSIPEGWYCRHRVDGQRVGQTAAQASPPRRWPAPRVMD